MAEVSEFFAIFIAKLICIKIVKFIEETVNDLPGKLVCSERE